MIANKWYCIAQTGTFDSGCTINVSFDSYVIQFSASVKYGSSAINITRCELPLSANLSLRLRESNGLWSVDLLSNNNITPEIVVADSPYWVALNSVAGAGNIILTLKDISKDFNTESGGSGGGLDENALRDFLDEYGYTRARDFWIYEETGGGAIHTGYHIIVDGGGAFGGAELGGGGESGGGGISEFYIQLGEGGQKYKLGNSGLPNVVQIPKYPVVPTNVSEFYNDAGYIGGEQAALIFSRISEVEGRVEKLEKLWWVDENGNLHTDYNIVVEKGGAFGTGASVDAGGSGGLGRVILVNDSGTEYASDENGIVRIPDYVNKVWFDAQNFASQSWVLSKGYVSDSALVPIREDITTLKKDVADLKGMWTIKDGKLYTTYSIVVEGGGSFGEGSESGGGSTGGLGQITIRNQAGQEYKTDANGVVVIPTYLTSNALDGYATQQWVESKKYLTSIPAEYITETELTAKGYAIASEIAKTYATIESLNTTNTNLATVTTGLANVATTVDALSKNFVNGIAKEAAKVSHALTFGSKTYDGSIARTILASDLDAVTLSGEQIITGAKTFGSLITANGGIKIPYTASLKIGDVTLIEDNGALKILGNLVVTGGGAFGDGASSGGGGGEGFSKIIIQTESGQSYTTNDAGVVTIPNYITSAALNGYAKLTDIPSSLPASDVYAWAKAATKPTYTASEVGALSTSGGTITGDLILGWHSSEGSKSIAFTVESGGNKAYLYADAYDLKYLVNSAYNTLIHSGNIGSQSVKRSNYVATMLVDGSGFYEDTYRLFGQWASDNNNICDWKAIGYEVRVDRARKLNTARTIWGQSFDGTADVSGILRLYDSNGYHANILGNTTGITLDTWRDDVGYFPIKLAPNGGNVLIGTTTDNGNKLQVNGGIHCDHIIRYDSNAGYLFGSRNTSLGLTDGGALVYAYGNTPISMYTNGLERMRVTGSGNILIGTTIDSGARLHINASAATTLQAVTTTTGLGIAQFLAPNAKTGVAGGMVLDFGVASSTYNSGNIAFRHHSSGNAANFVSIGLYGNDNILNVFGSGNVAIGTTDSNPAYKLDVQGGDVRFTGNLVVYGGGAFGSDVRYKNIINYTDIDLATIADAPLFTYQWNDREDKKVYLGTSAQYWENTKFAGVVNTTDPNFLKLDYGALAYGIGVSVARKVVDHEERIATLEKENKELKKKLNKYETLWHN